MITLLKKLRFLFLFIVILAFCLLRAVAAQKCLSWMEAFCGQAYLAIFISQLVGRYVATAK